MCHALGHKHAVCVSQESGSSEPNSSAYQVQTPAQAWIKPSRCNNQPAQEVKSGSQQTLLLKSRQSTCAYAGSGMRAAGLACSGSSAAAHHAPTCPRCSCEKSNRHEPLIHNKAPSHHHPHGSVQCNTNAPTVISAVMAVILPLLLVPRGHMQALIKTGTQPCGAAKG